MKRKIAVFSIFCFLFIGLLGCEQLGFLLPQKAGPAKAAPAVTPKGTVVAKVNNIPIMLADLNEEIDAVNAEAEKEKKPEAKITTRDQKIAYLKNQMVRRALLYQEALDRGIDRQEEIARVLEKTKEQLLLMELGKQEAEKIDVSSKEIEDYYNNAKKVGRTLFYEIVEPEERRISEIVVPAESEARDILIQILQGGDFATLARDRSKAASAKDGGDLGFITPGIRPAEFDSVAFSSALDVGKVSSIFKGPEGYYIIRIEAKRGGKEKSLFEMRDNIKGEITLLKQQQRIEDLLTKLSREAKIEIYEGEIK